MPRLTKFQFFEEGYAQLGVELGIISEAKFQKFIHYKVYLALIDEGFNHSTAIQITADKTYSNFSSVWRSVAYFQKKENRE